MGSTDRDGHKTIAIDKVDPFLVEGMRTLKAENDLLHAQEAKLEERVRALESGHRPLAAGLGGELTGLGGLALVAGAVVVSRKKRSDAATARPVAQ